MYGCFSGISLLYLKFHVYDKFKPITETEKMVSSGEISKVHFGDKFMIGMHQDGQDYTISTLPDNYHFKANMLSMFT